MESYEITCSVILPIGLLEPYRIPKLSLIFTYQSFVSPEWVKFPTRLLHSVLRPVLPQIVTVKCITCSNRVLKTLVILDFSSLGSITGGGRVNSFQNNYIRQGNSKTPKPKE